MEGYVVIENQELGRRVSAIKVESAQEGKLRLSDVLLLAVAGIGVPFAVTTILWYAS